MTASYSKFDYSKPTRTWVSEASDIAGPLNGGQPLFHQVYPDAADLGLTLVGKTGQQVDYVVCEEVCNEGDLVGWKLCPTKESAKRVPGCVGTKMLIAND